MYNIQCILYIVYVHWTSFQKFYFPEFRELCVKLLGCLYRVQIVRKFVQFKFLGVNPHKFSLKSTTEVNKGKNRKMIKRKIFIWRSTRNQKMKACSDCNSWNITRSLVFEIWREIYQFSLIAGRWFFSSEQGIAVKNTATGCQKIWPQIKIISDPNYGSL